MARQTVVLNANRLLHKLQSKIARASKDARGSVVVGYDTEYAVYVHENLMAYHKPPTQAKYLEQPARLLMRTAPAQIQAALRYGRVTLMQVLLRLGRQLLADSKRIVPVDTGALKASGFVRLER